MKTAIWTAFYVNLSPEDAILEIAKNGYKYAELSDEHGAALLKRGDPEAVGAAFGKFAREAGVTVSQGHLFLAVALCKEGAIEILHKWIDMFCAIGIQNAVLHPDISFPEGTPKEEIYEQNRVALQKLVAYIGERDLTICLENLRTEEKPRYEGTVPHPLHFSSDELLWYIDQIGDEHLGICLDTGHLQVSRAETQSSFIRKVGKRLKALHIADNEGERDQHLMPFCVGKLNVQEVIGALREVGYEGLFNFEIGGERRPSLGICAAKLKFLAECVACVENEI